jgi:hypothetical protein
MLQKRSSLSLIGVPTLQLVNLGRAKPEGFGQVREATLNGRILLHNAGLGFAILFFRQCLEAFERNQFRQMPHRK